MAKAKEGGDGLAAQQGQRVSLKVDWGEADNVPAEHVNMILANGVEDTVYLWFGHVAPPVVSALVPFENLEPDYWEKNPVKIQRITRLAMPVRTARILMRALQENLPAGDE